MILIAILAGIILVIIIVAIIICIVCRKKKAADKCKYLPHLNQPERLFSQSTSRDDRWVQFRNTWSKFGEFFEKDNSNLSINKSNLNLNWYFAHCLKISVLTFFVERVSSGGQYKFIRHVYFAQCYYIMEKKNPLFTVEKVFLCQFFSKCFNYDFLGNNAKFITDLLTTDSWLVF